jgi:hypothetical protein
MVGIGTTNPIAKLGINSGSQGALLITSDSGTESIWFDGAGEHLLVLPANQWRWRNHANSADRFIFSDSGALSVTHSVGIGTTGVPSHPLDVNENDDDLAAITRLSSSAGQDGRILLRALNSSGARKEYAAIEWWTVNTTAGSEQGALTFHTTTAGTSTERVRIDSSGNVGIGTANPGYKLHVVGDIFATGSITCGGSCGGGGGGSSQWTTSGSNIYYNAGNVGIGTASPGSALDVRGTLRLSGSTSGHVGLAAAAVAGSTTYTLPAGDGTNGQVLATNGSGTLSWTSGSSQWTTTGSDIYYTTGTVGIGTTSPAFPLEVRGQADILSVVSTGSIGAGIVLDASVGSGHKYHLYSTTSAAGQGAGYFLITDETASWADRIAIDPTGNVGIGTTVPSKKLEVNGQVKIGSFGSATSTTVCQLSGVLSTCSSSHRYKENILPAQFGLKDVMAMRPVIFKWKGRNEQDFGLIAEDVEKINPLFVTFTDNRVDGVKYPQLTAILIQAIQELKVDQERLKSEFDAYKKAHP